MRTGIRKISRAVLVMLFVCTVTVFTRAQIARAALPACPTATRDNFSVSGIGSTYLGVDLNLGRINVPNSAGTGTTSVAIFAETEVQCNGARVGYSSSNITYASPSVSVQKNKVYYYRIRTFYSATDPATKKTATVYGNWSPWKAVCTMQMKAKQVKRTRTVKIKVPKCAGVKSVKVQMSTKSNKGYKKVFTAKPGKSKKVSKFKKKAFKYYKNYYYRPVITLSDGTPCESAYYGYFYFRKVYY